MTSTPSGKPLDISTYHSMEDFCRKITKNKSKIAKIIEAWPNTESPSGQSETELVLNSVLADSI